MTPSAVTAVMLHWKRPDNVARIADAWRDHPRIAAGLIWGNNPDSPVDHDWATTINASRDLGLNTRFVAAALARTEAVLIQDDDLLLPPETVNHLVEQWAQDPQRVHGIFGRAAKPDGRYAVDLAGDVDAPIVLTRALVCHRDHVAAFLQTMPVFRDIQESFTPEGNGEDILFSYVARSRSGRLHRLHQVAYEELPAPDSIHGRAWRDHVAHRTRVMHRAEAWFAEQTLTPANAGARRPRWPALRRRARANRSA